MKNKISIATNVFRLKNARIPLPSRRLLNKIRRYIQHVSSQSSALIPNWLGRVRETRDPLLAAKTYASLSKKEVRRKIPRFSRSESNKKGEKKEERTRISLSSSRRKYRVFLNNNFEESRKPRNSEVGQESGCRNKDRWQIGPTCRRICRRFQELRKRGARCALFDSLSRGETRGNVVEFQAAPTASRINFRANRIDSGPLAICLDRDKRRSATLEAARRGATPTTLSTLLREDDHSWFTSALFYSIHRNCILAGITLSIM